MRLLDHGRTTMETPLEQAERQVARAREIVATQYWIVDRMKAQGRDAKAAEALLEQFKASVVVFEADLAEIKRKVGSS
jgi:hypothetical protein